MVGNLSNHRFVPVQTRLIVDLHSSAQVSYSGHASRVRHTETGGQLARPHFVFDLSQLWPLMSVPVDEQSSPPSLPDLHHQDANTSTITASEVAIIEPDTEPPLTTKELLLGATAVGYYLSLLMHILFYVAAAIGFLYFGNQLFDDELVGVNVRARLADEDVLDDQPLEELPEVLLDSPEVPSPLQQMSSSLEAIEEGLVETLKTDQMVSLGGSTDSEEEANSSGFLFKMPQGGLAVTKGSFTAWTSPEKPEPGQNYRIIIEVRLPNDVKRYRLSDLTGTVKGSDSFQRRIPFDRRTQFKSSSFYIDKDNRQKEITGRDTVTVRENKIQMVVVIPGGANEVRDVIQISSRRLHEKQELELVFGR